MVNLYSKSKRACVVCPRSHAKTTNARKFILHRILYKYTNYTLILGSSEDMAAQSLRWIRDQFVDNERLIEIYGNFYNKNKWSDTEFQTIDRVKVSAKGAGQKIRGANERGRPDLVYLDDVEEDEAVRNKDRRVELARWFAQAVMPALSKFGSIFVTGTILHIDSLLMNVSKNKVRDHIEWDVLFYQSIYTDAEGNERALWPEFKPLEQLKKLREVDPETFAQEYQNNPSSGAMGVFDRKEYKYYDQTKLFHDTVKNTIYYDGKILHPLLSTDLAI